MTTIGEMAREERVKMIAQTIRNWAHREDLYVPRVDDLADCIETECHPIDVFSAAGGWCAPKSTQLDAWPEDS